MDKQPDMDRVVALLDSCDSALTRAEEKLRAAALVDESERRDRLVRLVAATLLDVGRVLLPMTLIVKGSTPSSIERRKRWDAASKEVAKLLRMGQEP